jgi:pSer/pThr/pTyr-binding forkhead associated (FHA) protein
MNECQGTTAMSDPAGHTSAPACGAPTDGATAVCGDPQSIELTILDHYGRLTRFTLRGLPAILGRHDNADVILTDPWISHEHCKLFQNEGVLIVRDLDSKNGVFLHGARVLEAEVRPGDCLTLGRTEITVRYREPESGSADTHVIVDTAPVPETPRPSRPNTPHTEELLY